MSTLLFPSPVFGPVRSRRLGISLGVNLMPPDGKRCSFDCIYCECGFNADFVPQQPRPTRSEVRAALSERLTSMAEQGEKPDVITFAGNGEPTAHPDFAGIIADTVALRDALCPQAKVSVLSNATMTHRPEVRAALMQVDCNIQKLDTVSPAYIQLVNRPGGHYDVARIIAQLQAFEGHVIVQTLFMKGTWQGHSVDNTGASFVDPWLEAVRSIAPEQVMIYTIDRETPADTLMKATHEELDGIAAQVHAAGLQVSVSY